MRTTTVFELPKHPLHQLRDILGWSRETCAKETGLKAATIQNIERGAAPLMDDAAFAIEAATGCNAIRLTRSADAWRQRAAGQPRVLGEALLDLTQFEPVLLDGTPYKKEFYQHYKRAALQPQAVDKATDDLSRRIKLLLGPLAGRPEKFRRLYRYLVQVLNRAKDESGPSDAEMMEFARRTGEVKLEQPTLRELSQREEITASPVWKEADLLKRFDPDARVHVVREEFVFWPFKEMIQEGGHYVVPDYSFGTRTMWRITLPDGNMIVIAQNHVESGGLQAKLTDDAGNSQTAIPSNEGAAA